MVKRKNSVEPMPAYFLNPFITFIDLYINKELIVPGTLLKVKNDRTIYVFQRMCYNSKLDKEWIDLRSQSNGDWKSVYPDKIAGKFLAKRSRAKKNVG